MPWQGFPISSDECTFYSIIVYIISRVLCQPEVLGWREEVRLEELFIIV